MIGIDIVNRKRLDDLSIFDLILSDEEYSLYDTVKDKERFLAGRFAAKEALYKALLNQEGFDMTKITVLYKESRPFFKEYPQCVLSLSHEDHLTVAVVINLDRL